MDLLKYIRSDRAQRKEKKPFRPTLFARISALVQKHDLTEHFLVSLENPEGLLVERKTEVARIRKKEPFGLPLFSLCGEQHYRLAMEIIQRINNPYLEHASAPEEIALSKPLYDLNPSVGIERLKRYHFETLMHYELTSREVKDLEVKVATVRQKLGAESGSEAQQRELSTLSFLVKRMELLQTFIARVAEFETQ
jgi:hypothetical protein